MQDPPDAAELVALVRAFLTDEVLPATTGRTRFHARVAANVLGIVERELRLGPDADTAEAARLDALDVAPAPNLRERNRLFAATIRDGILDDRDADVRAALLATIAEKLAITDPGHL